MKKTPIVSNDTKLGSSDMDYTFGTHFSFSIGGFLDNFASTAYGVRTYAFYEILLGLDTGLVTFAWIFYGIWNMINDPLVGYLSDRNHKFVKKWGRRFPLIVLGSIPFSFSYLLIYFVPVEAKWAVFVWFLISICLFDTFYSLWQLNYLALLPVKFAKQNERTRIGGYNTIWGIVGVVFGMLLPPILIGDYTIRSGYHIAAVVVAVISVIASIAMIPGIREDKHVKQKGITKINHRETTQDRPSFWSALMQCLKNKNFMMYVILTLGHAVMTNLMLGSLQYWIQYVLGSDNADYETFIGAALLIGVIFSVPLWMWVSKSHGNRLAFIIGGFSASAILLLFFLIAKSLIIGIILTFFIGVSIGAFWTLMYPGLSDVIDELTVKSQFHNEGVFTGIRTFFSRFAFVIQAITMGVVHSLTGFVEGAPTQTPEATFGIRIHMSLVPMIFYLIGTLAIFFFYDLTPEKMKSIKAQLEEQKNR